MRIAIALCLLWTAATAAAEIPVTEGRARTADAVELHYRIAGSGEETVIAPFAAFHGDRLDPLARGRRIVTYDPRGRGRSAGIDPSAVSFDLLVDDIDAIRRAVGAERIALIGWSGGGQEAFAYALRHPGRVTRLVQLTPVAPRFEPWGMAMIGDRERRTDLAALAALNARRDAGAFEGDPAGFCRAEAAITNAALLADPADAALLPDLCAHANEHPEALGPYFGALFATVVELDWRERLGEVTIPRLVVHATEDNFPLEGTAEWVRGQPAARLLILERSGHFPLYEQPEATLEAIGTFLDGGWPEGARALP